MLGFPNPCPPEISGRARVLIAGMGGVCALLGGVVLLGWYLNLAFLIQLRPGLAPMQYNTALVFILAGFALGLWPFHNTRRAVLIPGCLVGAMGALTLSEYVFHRSLGIDQAFFHSYITTATSQIGRMSPVSASCFTLAGLGLLCLTFDSGAPWRVPVAGCIASVIISISLVAISGYALGLPGTYGWGQLNRLAAHTAIGLGLLGASIFIIAWNASLHPFERTPRWLPAPLALGIFTGSVVLYFALEARQNDDAMQTVTTAAESAANQITMRMESRMRAFVRMAQRWEFSGAPSRAAWEADAGDYVHDFPELQALEWTDASRFTRWIVPMAGNESKLNRNLITEARRSAAIDQAQRQHLPVITHIVNLFRGGLGFIIYIPIVVNGEPEGFITAVFNARECLRRFLPSSLANGESIELFDDDRKFYSRDILARTNRPDWVAEKKIELPGATWTLRMAPTADLATRLDSPLPQVVFCAGLLCSLLLSGVCFFSQRSSRKAAETSRANAALQAALDTVKTLRGLLPICCSCKRVRDDTGYWSQIDTYLSENTNASLSHGYCPECAARAFRDFGFEVPEAIHASVAAGNFEEHSLPGRGKR